jgi:AraC-like DNA-binding protein
MVLIKRLSSGWIVIDDDRILHDHLELLAAKCGFRVGDISSKLGISEQHLRRTFQRDVGIGIKQWIEQERMVFARKMLLSAVHPEDVSEALGFAHPNSFRRSFKEAYRMTPPESLRRFHQRNQRFLEHVNRAG